MDKAINHDFFFLPDKPIQGFSTSHLTKSRHSQIGLPVKTNFDGKVIDDY